MVYSQSFRYDTKRKNSPFSAAKEGIDTRYDRLAKLVFGEVNAMVERMVAALERRNMSDPI